MLQQNKHCCKAPCSYQVKFRGSKFSDILKAEAVFPLKRHWYSDQKKKQKPTNKLCSSKESQRI